MTFDILVAFFSSIALSFLVLVVAPKNISTKTTPRVVWEMEMLRKAKENEGGPTFTFKSGQFRGSTLKLAF